MILESVDGKRATFLLNPTEAARVVLHGRIGWVLRRMPPGPKPRRWACDCGRSPERNQCGCGSFRWEVDR